MQVTITHRVQACTTLTGSVATALASCTTHPETVRRLFGRSCTENGLARTQAASMSRSTQEGRACGVVTPATILCR